MMTSAIEMRLHGKSTSTSVLDSVVYGCYSIMRTFKSYTLTEILSDNFKFSQFLILNDLIKEENDENKKQMDKAKNVRGKR